MEKTDRNNPNDTSEGGERNASYNPFALLEAELLLGTATEPLTPNMNSMLCIPSQRKDASVRFNSTRENAQSCPRNQSSRSARRIPIQESIVGFRYVVLISNRFSMIFLYSLYVFCCNLNEFRPEHWNTSSTAQRTKKRAMKRRNLCEKETAFNVENVSIKEPSPVLQPMDAFMEADATVIDDPAKLSFRPRFFSTQFKETTSTEKDDRDSVAVQNPDDTAPPPSTDADGMINPMVWRPTWFQDRNGVTSPIAAKRSRGTSSEPGPLLKRLQAIRQSVQGDMVRLSSGQYPFSLRQLDRNDPRNRANTVMDLTILGNPSVAGDQSLVTLPCFVHNWMKVTSDSDRTFQVVDIPKQQASIMFTCDTIHEQSIGHGSQLRVYNAIYIPIRQPLVTHTCDALTANPTFPDEDGVIVCTQLCEPYPKSILPPLVPPSATTS
jgi:hypothetical protein